MTPSGVHENRAYMFHIALDVAEGTTKKLKGSTSTAVTWEDGKFFDDTGSSDKTDQMRSISKKVLAKNKIQKYLLNTCFSVKNKKATTYSAVAPIKVKQVTRTICNICKHQNYRNLEKEVLPKSEKASMAFSNMEIQVPQPSNKSQQHST